MLSGYKTYITGIVAIVTALGGYLSGAVDLPTTVMAIFAAAQTMNLRDAINKALGK
jgi:hypothetical protein